VTDSDRKPLTRRRALQASLATAGVGAVVGMGTITALMRRGGMEARFFTAAEMALLEEVCEIVIPATDTPGARAANVHGVIDALMSEWARVETQAKIRLVLERVEENAQFRFKASFIDLSSPQQTDIVRAADAATFPLLAKGDVGFAGAGFRLLKQLIFRSYYLSEIGATVELQFELVPGEHRGCLPLADVGRAWAA